MVINILWLVFVIALLIWVPGLALSLGGWMWIFFVIALVAGGINILSLTDKKSGKRYSRRRYISEITLVRNLKGEYIYLTNH